MGISVGQKLALHGGEPLRGPDAPWPAWPVFDAAERDGLLEVLESGQWWYGDRVESFEEAFAAFQDAKYCVSCTNGTVGLEIVMQALDIGPGHEVILPPFTFVATATAILRRGAVPVFADIDPSWNIDPTQIEKAVTTRTKAIIPVHFGGLAADMDRINAIAQDHGLLVLEDACHSWGTKWKGRGTGALGTCGVFSFQASKNITAGEGGAIVTNDEALAQKCKSLINSGRVDGREWYLHFEPGTNARLTEFAAALLHAQLGRLEEQNALRERNAALLDSALGQIEGLTPQPGDPRVSPRAYHLYGLRIDPQSFGCSRDAFVKAANVEGLPIASAYPIPLYKQPLFKNQDYRAGACPVCEDFCARSAMWLRHSLLLATHEDMNQIAAICQKVKDHAGSLD